MKNRDTLFDSAKFILISLVILGHAIEVVFTLNGISSIWKYIYTLIYMFHMPLFVFISGYFSKNINDVKVLKKSILCLTETYIIFQTLNLILSKQLVYSIGSILSSYIYPYWILWYLMSLIFWKIIGYVIIKQKLNNLKTILFFTILALIVGLIPFIGKSFSLSRTIVLAPFFILGLIINDKHIAYIRTPKIKVIALLIIILSAIANILIYNIPGIFQLLWNSYPYDANKQIESLLLRLILLINAGLLSFSFMSIIPRKLFFKLERYGSLTMIFFIFHIYFLKLTHIVLDYLEINKSISLFICVFSTILILILISKINGINYIFNPHKIKLKKRLRGV